MTIWLPDPAKLKRPAYRALAQAMVRAVQAGELQPGERLPTHRDLAYQLGLSVQTVSRAYEELKRQGVISGEVGRGTFVLSRRGEDRTPWQRLPEDEAAVDCSMLTPVTDDWQAKRFRQVLGDLSQETPPEVLFSFRPRAVLARHRRVALDWLAQCGVQTRSDLVLPTNGSTAAMTVALMTATSPGDLVVTEAFGHHTLPSLASYLGLRLVGLPIDSQGLRPEALVDACREADVRAVYLVPNGLSPVGFVMSPERRREISEIARRHEVLIIENDAAGPLQPTRAAPLAALAPERVFYFTSFTKCLLPGLRYGFLVPPASLASAAMNRHLVTNWMATGLMAEIATRWIGDGTAMELLRWQRAALKERNRVVERAFEGLRFSASPNGLHVWLPLGPAWDEEAFVALARYQGVAVAAGSAFVIGEGEREKGVRISLGGPSIRDLSRGLDVIANLVRERPEPAMLAI